MTILAARADTPMPAFPRSIALLGSTGSIGTQAEQVLLAHPDLFSVVALAAGGSDLGALAAQAVRLRPRLLVAARGETEDLAQAVAETARGLGRPDPVAEGTTEVAVGAAAVTRAAGCGADIVLNGIDGAAGLRATVAALQASSMLALANKESLIIGGPLMSGLARPGQVIPVDSEHSAIAQCLRAGEQHAVRRLVITASGGPFRGRARDELHEATPEQALAHPNFAMGRLVTTNSATLVNKGLEVIEAHLLFGLGLDRIHVVVHPQQQVHSMVEYVDGSTIAQCGPPRMLVPIALGLSWPRHLDPVDVPCDWAAPQSWTFEPLDEAAFPSVPLAYQVGNARRTYPAVYNAANEVAVEAFHDHRIRFTEIVPTIQRVVEEHQAADHPTLEDVLAADGWGRERARAILDL